MFGATGITFCLLLASGSEADLKFIEITPTERMASLMATKNNDDRQALIVFGLLGLILITAISKAPWCGPACQVILSDARGMLVQDMVTGLRLWVPVQAG